MAATVARLRVGLDGVRPELARLARAVLAGPWLPPPGYIARAVSAALARPLRRV